MYVMKIYIFSVSFSPYLFFVVGYAFRVKQVLYKPSIQVGGL